MIGRRLFDVDAFESWVERMILQHRDRFTLRVLVPKVDRLNAEILAARADREALQWELERAITRQSIELKLLKGAFDGS